MECRFTLRLEGNNNKTNKDVDHEEGDDDEIHEIKEKHMWTVVLFRTNICLIRVDGDIQNAENRKYLNYIVSTQRKVLKS